MINIMSFSYTTMPAVKAMASSALNQHHCLKFPLFPNHQELAIVLYPKELRFIKGKKLIVLLLFQLHVVMDMWMKTQVNLFCISLI